MIIKLKVDERCSWRFYDGAREVQYATVDRADAFKPEGMDDEDLVDGISVETEETVFERFLTKILPDDKYCLLITFRDHDGKPHNLYTDAESYLLNDSGKTIERIN